MRNLKQYWAQVREIQTRLEQSHPEGVHLTMLPDGDKGIQGGTVVAALPALAAKLIVDGTHRRATDEEVAAYLKRDELAGSALKAREDLLRRLNGRPAEVTLRLAEAE